MSLITYRDTNTGAIQLYDDDGALHSYFHQLSDDTVNHCLPDGTVMQQYDVSGSPGFIKVIDQNGGVARIDMHSNLQGFTLTDVTGEQVHVSQSNDSVGIISDNDGHSAFVHHIGDNPFEFDAV